MTNTIQSIDRAFEIMETLSMEARGMSIKELSERLTLNKSTVHRILATLIAWGYVEKNAEDKRYKLGPKIINLGSVYLNNIELKTEALPYLHNLKERTGQVVHLAIIENGDVVYLDKIDIVSNIRMYSKIGKRAMCHNTGLGKAMMAFMPEREVDKILKEKGMPKVMERTITDPKALKDQLNVIRQRGWAIDDEENELGIRCAAAPVFDYTGNVIAAISSTGPLDLYTYEFLDEKIADLVKEAAYQISKRMGYQG